MQQQQPVLQTSLFVHAFVLFIVLNDIPLVSLSFTPSLMQNSLKHVLRNELLPYINWRDRSWDSPS